MGTGTVAGQVSLSGHAAHPAAPRIRRLQGSHMHTVQETDNLTKDSFQEREAIHISSLSVGKLRTGMLYGILK